MGRGTESSFPTTATSMGSPRQCPGDAEEQPELKLGTQQATMGQAVQQPLATIFWLPASLF